MSPGDRGAGAWQGRAALCVRAGALRDGPLSRARRKR